MNTTRREFIKTSALAVAGTTLFSSCNFSATTKNELMGLQLYCVRDEMGVDPLNTLKELAKIGYKNVEHANYVDRKFYGWSATEFKKILDDLGMKMPSGHTGFGNRHWDEAKNDFTDLWKYTVEDAATMEQQFVISPSLNKEWHSSEDVLKRYMDIFNKNGELCKKSGMKFGYHNHWDEFLVKFGDKSMYDVILENTDKGLVIHQLDIGNLYNGGAKAIDIVQKYPGRFQSMHVKDEILSDGGNEKYESTILGKGVVNTKEVIDLGRKFGGTIHFIVEQESYQGKTPLECMKEDYDIMKGWGY